MYLVAIVAVFETLSDDAVTADLHQAIVATAVVIDLVAVIARFIAGFVIGEIVAMDAITAARRLAGIGAIVPVVLIAIITAFKTGE